MYSRKYKNINKSTKSTKLNKSAQLNQFIKRNKYLKQSKKYRKYKAKNLIGGSNKNSKKKQCPPNMKLSKLPNGEVLCIGRCPHSGGIVTYKPKLDKLVCNLHGAQFEKSGKVIHGSGPANSNVKVVKLK